jgi:hypothetical protein
VLSLQRLMDLLEEAQALDDPATKELVFSGVDRGIEGNGKVYSYQRSMPVELVRNPDILVAYQVSLGQRVWGIAHTSKCCSFHILSWASWKKLRLEQDSLREKAICASN